ncbi:MAG: hypothetical protein MPJ50_05355 [Pirellulales bacterium]|nr:hypothetical protein [Pirellulales bacterium]
MSVEKHLVEFEVDAATLTSEQKISAEADKIVPQLRKKLAAAAGLATFKELKKAGLAKAADKQKIINEAVRTYRPSASLRQEVVKWLKELAAKSRGN